MCCGSCPVGMGAGRSLGWDSLRSENLDFLPPWPCHPSPGLSSSAAFSTSAGCSGLVQVGALLWSWGQDPRAKAGALQGTAPAGGQAHRPRPRSPGAT